MELLQSRSISNRRVPLGVKTFFFLVLKLPLLPAREAAKSRVQSAGRDTAQTATRSDNHPFVPQTMPGVTRDWPNNASLPGHQLTFLFFFSLLLLEIMRFVRER